jgi:hypothetical protein
MRAFSVQFLVWIVHNVLMAELCKRQHQGGACRGVWRMVGAAITSHIGDVVCTDGVSNRYVILSILLSYFNTSFSTRI